MNGDDGSRRAGKEEQDEDIILRVLAKAKQRKTSMGKAVLTGATITTTTFYRREKHLIFSFTSSFYNYTGLLRACLVRWKLCFVVLVFLIFLVLRLPFLGQFVRGGLLPLDIVRRQARNDQEMCVFTGMKIRNAQPRGK